MSEEIKPANPAGGAAVAPLAPKTPPGVPGNAAAPTGAEASVPLFGGNRGGRKRADGLPPGSAEAVAADKKRDAERKKRARDAAAKVAEPPPLPSAAPGQPGAAPSPAAAGEPGLVAPEPAVPPPVPWQPELLQDLTDELIEAAEVARVEKFIEKAKEANLPDKIVREIAKDSHFPAVGKRSIKVSAPRVGAKLLNKAGVSSEYRDEIALFSGLALILSQGRKLSAKLDELIAEAQQDKTEVRQPSPFEMAAAQGGKA